MSWYFPIRDFARIALPTFKRDGLFVMLCAYFDDSGTHGDSHVVVMGGLIGSLDQWGPLEAEWAALLANPLSKSRKPPLTMFHLSQCRAGWGEFEGYSEGERDAVTHDFRQILIKAQLASFAAAIDRKAWNELVVGEARHRLGNDLHHCVARCIEETIQIADPHPLGDAIAITFDCGMWTKKLSELANPYTFMMGRPRVKSVNAVRVEEMLPLQAADIVATENYWHALDVLKLGLDAASRAHMRHYLSNMPHLGVILGRPEIEALITG